jgi:hypothetical protein
MKTFLNYALCCIVAALVFVGCEANNNTTPPSLELTAVDSTSSSIKFVINTDAEECSYMLYDGENINAETILNEGTPTKSGVITISDLEADTKYYVAVAATNGGLKNMQTIMMQTKEASNNGGGNDDNGGNGGNDDNFELPDIDGVENIVIEKTKDGRWYEPYNYYVTFVRDNGDRIILDFYTLDETMSQYFPYGQYTFATNYYPYTIHSETSGYVPAGKSADGEGYLFTDGYVTVDVVNGYYAIYMMLTYDEDGTSKSIQGYYNGILSGASVPEGDNIGSKELIEVLEVGTTSFQFRINAEEGQYWRCSVIDKRTYDQYQSNPGAWVVTYGFMLEGPLTFNWENGKICEHVPGLQMSVTSSTDYLILAALMDYSEGQENSLLGGVEIVQIRTEAETAGTGTVDINIKEINTTDIVFDCILGDNVWGCYVAMMETANLQEIKDGKYAMAGYSSYEECMLSLIPGLSHDFKRQFLETTYDYKWDYLKYNTSYTICVKVEDMDGGVSFIELEPFTTL